MKELKNVVSVIGELVKVDIKDIATKNGDEAIAGSIVLRTADGSEHEFRVYSNKYKKDENKQITTEESYFYKMYSEFAETAIDLEHALPEAGIYADIIKIDDGRFTANDFKNPKDGKVISSNKLSCKFINKINTERESAVREAKFEVEGIIDSMTDEVKKNEPTGNLVVNMLAINQTADGFGKDAKYEADSLVPIRMIVEKSMVDAFRSAGYYDGCFTKFVGDVVSRKEKTLIVEEAAFGNNIEKEATVTIRQNVIKSGTKISTIEEHELTEEVVNALRSKRKALLAEIQNGTAATADEETPFKADKSTPASNPGYNPFASR